MFAIVIYLQSPPICYVIYYFFKVILYNLRDATGSNTPVEWNSCLDCESVIPRSPLTALVGCEHHEIGAVQFLLLHRHLTPKESRCLGQIVSWRCELSISNTPVRWKWKTETNNCIMTCCIYQTFATLRLCLRSSFLRSPTLRSALKILPCPLVLGIKHFWLWQTNSSSATYSGIYYSTPDSFIVWSYAWQSYLVRDTESCMMRDNWLGLVQPACTATYCEVWPDVVLALKV